MILTPEQKNAAEAPCSVAVTAGAGTGKTRMLAHRYLHHVVVGKMSPLSIVAVTFTDKAADELRSRIRATLAENIAESGEDALAEVDAAQISTMHSLAARICRDFYDLAGIPSDFSVMDESEAFIWKTEKVEEAIRLVDAEIVRELGYSRLLEALVCLLSDTFSADEAFEQDTGEWQEIVDATSGPRLKEFVNTPAFQNARIVVEEIRGEDGDNLEAARRAAYEAIRNISRRENVCDAFSILAELRAGRGKASAWPGDGKARMAEALKELKEKAKEFLPTAGLEFGDPDRELARQSAILKRAYMVVRDHLRTEKLRAKVLDYNDLEFYALRILENDDAAKHYRERWRAFLIDEFQDTNPVQARMIRRLTERALTTIVGDEKQSIYGFRRADVAGFADFRKQIVSSGGREEFLDQTFRAHRGLVGSMNQMFAPMLGELHQPLRSERAADHCTGGHIEFNCVEDGGDRKRNLQVIEARHIASRIRSMIDDGVQIHDGKSGTRAVEPSDFAVLSRTWEPLDVYLDALAAEGVPAVHSGGGSLLDTREFKDAYALLRFLADTTDDIALIALLRSPFFGVSDRQLYALARTKPKDTAWWPATKGKLEASQTIDRLIVMSSKVSVLTLLLEADRLTGYRAIIANLQHGERREADWRAVIEALLDLEKAGKPDVFSAVRHFKRLIDAEIEIARPPLEAERAVSLMTIHRAKGLEWPIVFVSDLAKGLSNSAPILFAEPGVGVVFAIENEEGEKEKPAIFSIVTRRRAERERAEMRRLLYVAITRASEKVIVTATADKGPYLDLLRDGLEAAGVNNEPIPYDATLSVHPAPLTPEMPAASEVTLTEPLAFPLDRLPVTALSAYVECPLKFKFRFVDGHPGLGTGPAVATGIGTLTHRALELGISTREELIKFADGNEEHIDQALTLANAFTASPVYEPVRAEDSLCEQRFVHEEGGLRFTGAVDLAGQDFVLDYKTDSEVEPEIHRFQLWLYAKAFGKPKAYIAYLRKGLLHEYSREDLAKTEAEFRIMAARIKSCDYRPIAEERTCGRCHYSEVCESKFAGSPGDAF